MFVKTVMALALGVACQGCSIINDFYRDRFEQQARQQLARVAERMAYNQELRDAAYEPFQQELSHEENDQIEHAAKRTMKKAGQATLKAGWRALTADTTLDGIVEPSFKDEEGNIVPTVSELAMQEQPKRDSRYKLGFMPTVRLGDESGGGFKARNATVLAVRGDDYWKYKAHANIFSFRVAGEYRDYDIEEDRYKFGIGKGPFSLSFERGSEDDVIWFEFFK